MIPNGLQEIMHCFMFHYIVDTNYETSSVIITQSEKYISSAYAFLFSTEINFPFIVS